MDTPTPAFPDVEDRLGMTDAQWAQWQAYTRGYGEQDENGVDLSLLRENLKLTPTERLQKHQTALRLFWEICRAGDGDGFLAALTTLEAARVQFVLVGGLAMVAQGSAYITPDIDICYAPGLGHLAALVTALEPFHPRLRDASEGSLLSADALQDTLSLALTTDLADTDFYSDVPGIPSFDAVWNQSIALDLNGTAVHVASVDDLIAMKCVRGTVGDRLHLMELEALRKLQADSLG